MSRRTELHDELITLLLRVLKHPSDFTVEEIRALRELFTLLSENQPSNTPNYTLQ